jgi:hypothetical protein
MALLAFFLQVFVLRAWRSHEGCASNRLPACVQPEPRGVGFDGVEVGSLGIGLGHLLMHEFHELAGVGYFGGLPNDAVLCGPSLRVSAFGRVLGPQSCFERLSVARASAAVGGFPIDEVLGGLLGGLLGLPGFCERLPCVGFVAVAGRSAGQPWGRVGELLVDLGMLLVPSPEVCRSFGFLLLLGVCLDFVNRELLRGLMLDFEVGGFPTWRAVGGTGNTTDVLLAGALLSDLAFDF